MRAALAVLFAAILAACTPAPGTEFVSMGESVNIASAGALISAQRAQAGIVRPLIQHPRVQAAAADHARFLAQTGGFSHTGRGGSSARERVWRAGYRSCLTAENIARGQPTVSAVVRDWMQSAGHRANILDARLTHFGFAREGDTWVLVLAAPC